jgi:branched-chain amino acid transport system substrate-binding protein
VLSQVRPIKIGLTIPLTGPFANTVAEYMPAFQLGVEVVNKAGGVNGRPLQLLVEDSQASPAGGIAAMRKLVEVDGVQGVMTSFSSVVTAQIPLAEQLQVPVVAVIETPGIVNKAAFVFAHGTRIASIQPLLGQYWKKFGVKRIYAFFPNSATGQALTPGFREDATAAGAEFAIALINLGDSDFRGELARAKAYGPDAIYFLTGGSIADATLVRQAREIGLNQQMYTSGNVYTLNAWRMAIGAYSEGLILGGSKIDERQARDFIRGYRAKTGYEPGYVDGEMFDLVKILAYGLARGSNGVAVRDAIAKLSGVPSVLGGNLEMASDHYTVVPKIAVYQIRRGVEVQIYPTPT